MAVCARGSGLVFYAVFAGFFSQLFGKIKKKKKYGSGRFSGSGADDHSSPTNWSK